MTIYRSQSDRSNTIILLLKRMRLASNIGLIEHLARSKQLPRIFSAVDAGVQSINDSNSWPLEQD